MHAGVARNVSCGRHGKRSSIEKDCGVDRVPRRGTGLRTLRGVLPSALLLVASCSQPVVPCNGEPIQDSLVALTAEAETEAEQLGQSVMSYLVWIETTIEPGSESGLQLIEDCGIDIQAGIATFFESSGDAIDHLTRTGIPDCSDWIAFLLPRTQPKEPSFSIINGSRLPRREYGILPFIGVSSTQQDGECIVREDPKWLLRRTT